MEIVQCTTIEQLIDHYLVRKIVFIDEQRVTYEDEFDLTEKTRIPFIVYLNKLPIGTARLNINNSSARAERIAVLKEYRNKKIGSRLMEFLFEYCLNLDIKEMIVGAQIQAVSFYEKLGFIKYGELYYDANIPHYKMKKNLI